MGDGIQESDSGRNNDIVEVDGTLVQLCSICEKPTKGDVFPGAEVRHIKCALEVTKELRE